MDASDLAFGTIEPQLQGPLPRHVRYTAGTQVTRMFVLILVVGGVGLLLWLANRDLSDYAALQAHGVPTSAIITEMHVVSGRVTTYYVTYRFTVEGATVSGADEVPASVYNATNIGGPLQVTYLPGHPSIHCVGTVDNSRIAGEKHMWLYLLLYGFLVLGGVFLFIERYYRGHRWLLENGVPVSGQVTDRNILLGLKSIFFISYQFLLPSGTQKNTIYVTGDAYNACIPGMVMTVLYDPTRPGRNRLYRALNDVTVS